MKFYFSRPLAIIYPLLKEESISNLSKDITFPPSLCHQSALTCTIAIDFCGISHPGSNPRTDAATSEDLSEFHTASSQRLSTWNDRESPIRKFKVGRTTILGFCGQRWLLMQKAVRRERDGLRIQVVAAQGLAPKCAEEWHVHWPTGVQMGVQYTLGREHWPQTLTT